MKIEELIRSRRTVREFTKKPLSKKNINKIIEAGKWAPSVHNTQPWRYVIITKQAIIKMLGGYIIKESKKLLIGFNLIAKEAGMIILNSPALIIINNSCELSNRMLKYGDPYYRLTLTSEFLSLGASIENMLLMAHSLGIGGAWLTAPLLCNININKIIKTNGIPISLVALGYPCKNKLEAKARGPINTYVIKDI